MKLFGKKRVFMNGSAVVHCCLLTGISYSLFTWAQTPLTCDEVITPIIQSGQKLPPQSFAKLIPFSIVSPGVRNRPGPAWPGWAAQMKNGHWAELRSRVWFNSQFPRHLLRNKVWQGAGAPLDLFLPPWSGSECVMQSPDRRVSLETIHPKIVDSHIIDQLDYLERLDLYSIGIDNLWSQWWAQITLT